MIGMDLERMGREKWEIVSIGSFLEECCYKEKGKSRVVGERGNFCFYLS